MNGAERQGRTRIRELLDRFEVRPRKSMGQHFLADPNIVDRIVRTAGVGSGDRVVEVGAGTGALTAALCATGAMVVSYEVDERLRPVLEGILDGLSNVEVRFADALDADLQGELGAGTWVLVANLPYNIGVRLLIDVLRNVSAVERAVVMLQREVADRLVAGPGMPTYGLASVSVALRARVRRAFNVSGDVFIPPPDVESSVIVVERVPESPHAGCADMLAAAAFNQRRKMLRRSLATVLADPIGMLEPAGLDPTARAEDLSVEDYLRLAEEVTR